MVKTLQAATLALIFASPAAAAEPEIVPHLQNISVTIKAGFSEGSGVIFKREKHSFVWTAAHVVAGLRKERRAVDAKTGATKTVVEFEDAKVVKVLVEDGRTVGRYELDAEVIKYSDADHGQDLALLRVRAKGQFAEGTKFYKSEKPPQLGTKLYHVGSLLGELGGNSLTDGIVSQRGRLINKTIYDQTNATSFPGSSGGGIYEAATGKYVGMLVRGAGEGFSLYVPVRRMRDWSRKVKVDWAMDETIKMPGAEPWKNLPIEDAK